MKRVLIMVVAFAGFSAFAVEANAGEPKSSNVSKSVLASLGLGGMRAMSNDEGMQVRGKSVVFGTPGSGFFITRANPNSAKVNGVISVIHAKSIGSTAILGHPTAGFKIVP